MDAIAALCNRVSQRVLTEPAPSGEVFDNIMRAALRAADHAMLRPWRFLVVEGDGLQCLGEIFVRARLAAEGELSERERARAASRPLRAPMVIVAIAAPKANTKVPEVEQIISAGAAVQNLLNAAFAQGVGAMWRTGDFAYDPIVRKGLEIAETERIIGFVYLGTVGEERKPSPPPEPSRFFFPWP